MMVEVNKSKEFYENENLEKYGRIQFETDAFERDHSSNICNFRIKNTNLETAQGNVEITEVTSSTFGLEYSDLNTMYEHHILHSTELPKELCANN